MSNGGGPMSNADKKYFEVREMAEEIKELKAKLTIAVKALEQYSESDLGPIPAIDALAEIRK